MLRESLQPDEGYRDRREKQGKKRKGIARHGGMFMTAVVWLQGSLNDAKAVSGNTFICPYFLLPSLWIHHPSVALFLQHFFFCVSPKRSLSQGNLRSDSSLGMLEKMIREPKKKERERKN